VLALVSASTIGIVALMFLPGIDAMKHLGPAAAPFSAVPVIFLLSAAPTRRRWQDMAGLLALEAYVAAVGLWIGHDLSSTDHLDFEACPSTCPFDTAATLRRVPLTVAVATLTVGAALAAIYLRSQPGRRARWLQGPPAAGGEQINPPARPGP
jgi:hypothetical protein